MSDTRIDDDKTQSKPNGIIDGIKDFFSKNNDENINNEEYNKAMQDVDTAKKEVSNIVKIGEKAEKDIERNAKANINPKAEWKPRVDNIYTLIRHANKDLVKENKKPNFSGTLIKRKNDKKTRQDYEDFINEIILRNDEFIEKYGLDKRTPPEVVFRTLMAFAKDGNPKATEEIADDIRKANVVHDRQTAVSGKANSGNGNSQGAVNNQQAAATHTTPTTPTTPQKKSDTEDLTKGGLGDGIPEVGSFFTPDVREELNAIDKSMEKEQQTGHRFYSRIFSVPEWFPKGLDEFREKKKELTDKPVYDKVSGKYVRNTTGEMATAKAEQKMAEDALSGMEDELRKMYVGVSDIQKEQKQADKAMKEAEEIGKENYKEYVKDVIQDKNRKTEPVFVKDKEDFINEAKIDAGLATYDPTTGKTHSYDENKKTTKELIQDQKAAIDAIKNGDLKDANEAVDNLKEEYRAAKRKLIKENAGDIARNVWFIIDLVTTMNRNAARLMPQGKYSPNLGNFETPALFQDYAEQLKNMRDSYNEANKEAAVGKVKLGLERGSEANKAIGEYYKNLADKDKDIFDLSVQTEKDRRQAMLRIMENKETSRLDNELKKDYIKFYMDTHKNTQASLQQMLNDVDTMNTFVNRPRVLAGLDKEQQQNWLYYNLYTSPDAKDAIFRELVTDVYRRGIDEKKSDKEIKDDVRSLLIDLIRNEVATTNDTLKLKRYQNKLDYINRTTDTIGKTWENIIDKPINTATNVVDSATNVIKAMPNATP